MSAPGQKNAQTEEDSDNKTLGEKELQRRQQEYFDEEVPEAEQMAFFLQLAAGAGLLYSEKRSNVYWAFDKLNDPNFANEILKVMDPRKFQELKSAIRIAEQEINNQRKTNENRSVKKDEAEVGVWGAKRKMGFTTFDRKKQAFGLADAVQTRIGAFEIKIKLQNAARMYGVELGTLQRDLAGWLKENPGHGVDEYIAQHGSKLYREKMAKEGKEPEKDIDKKVQKENEKARLAAVKENKEQIIRAQQEIKRTLALTDGQKISNKDQLRAVLHGNPPPQIQTTAPSPPPTPPAAPVSIPSPPIASAPSIPVTVPRVSLPAFSGIRQGLGSFFGGFGGLVGGFTGGVGSFLGNGVNSLFSGGLGMGLKSAARRIGGQLLGSLAPGVGNVIVGVAQFLGLDKLVFDVGVKAVVAVLAVAIGLPFVMILFFQTNTFSYRTGNNSMLLSSTNERFLGWATFDKQFLTINTIDNNSGWPQFVLENLTKSKQYLSLDAHGHDDVEK